jgi:NADP-dependent 3-hydroxy acid dehydrogenase YdfG
MPRRAPVTVDGHTAFITGAGSGIGRAVAQRLSAHGCPVAIADIDGAALEATAASLSGAVLTRVLDVRDREAQFACAQEVAEWAPAPLGMVFNNAGVATSQPIAGSVVEDDEWVLDINLSGVIHGTRAFLPILLRQGSGVIVNTSSVFGLIGVPAQSAYCASKFAVRGFTESLRAELRGTGVHAVTVHPGGIKTNIARNARFHADPRGTPRSHAEAAQDFEAIARTTPEHAAEVIHRGVKAGKSRILVGRDAYVLDLLVRVAPVRYADVVAGFIALSERGRISTRRTARLGPAAE